MKSEWATAPLGNVISYMSKGIVPSYTEEFSDFTVRVLNQKCNRDYVISYDAARLNDCRKKSIPAGRMLQIGDILINSTGIGTAGRVAQLSNIEMPTTFDGHMIVVRANKQIIDPLYLGYAIKSKQLQVETLAEGSTGQTEINRIRLSSEVIIDYPIRIDVQKKVAQTLAAIDQLIIVNKAINDNLQQQAAAIYKAWFVDFTPFDSSPPQKWTSVTLDELTSLVCRGIAPKYSDNSRQIVLNQKCIRNHMVDLSLARTHIPKTINEKWVQFGDVLINSTGEGTLGRIAQMWFETENITVDSHITIVRPANKNLVFYVGLWAITHEKEIEALHTGSTGQTELPRERVKGMGLALPDDATLYRFNAVIAPMVSTIVKNQKENQKLAVIRDILLPKLMSGKIDVSDVQV